MTRCIYPCNRWDAKTYLYF